MMKPGDLDSIFDPTPDIFTNRVDTVLRTLKEDEPVKKFTLRTGIAALAFTLLFCSIAFAVVLTQGQEWYYNNRFTAYQEHDPSLQQAIITHLETEVPQEPSHDAQNLVNATVQDYAWVPEKNLLTISVCAQLKDSVKYELHPLMAMDADGYWSDTLDPSNPESRVEHWLSTDKGFGPPPQVMNDPSKSLLLADIGSSNTLIGDSDIPLFTTTYDSFTGENGTVISVMEIECGNEDSFHAAISQYTDKDGMLTLRLPYQVIPFENGSFSPPIDGVLTFKIKIQ